MILEWYEKMWEDLHRDGFVGGDKERLALIVEEAENRVYQCAEEQYAELQTKAE